MINNVRVCVGLPKLFVLLGTKSEHSTTEQSITLSERSLGETMRRRGGGAQEGENPDDVDVDGVESEIAGPVSTRAAVATAPGLRQPRHGGWKGTKPGRGAAMLRGEPGYHLGE